jgi:hypothetical protein
MDKSTLIILQNRFDGLSQTVPDEGIEFWFARDLMEPLGYVRWENFQTAIQRAITSCETTGYEPNDHFRGVTKMVKLGSGAERSPGGVRQLPFEAQKALVLSYKDEQQTYKPDFICYGKIIVELKAVKEAHQNIKPSF